MPASRPILIAGAGIGVSQQPLRWPQAGFDVAVIEQADRLEEAGAGIQLSPNATRVSRRSRSARRAEGARGHATRSPRHGGGLGQADRARAARGHRRRTLRFP